MARTQPPKMEGNQHDQTEWEKKNGLVSRQELMEHMIGYLNELSDMEFHGLYSIFWTLSARKTLIDVNKRNGWL